ncbi:cytochrome c oxidase subunit II [Halogeometricum luteum]|uniref:cytochrome-c oxidase n=1 Tax=Halogeometricum luteum TaxID=2950537 RepID=A0ABU2G9K1_9EURY|nr:cytochrome c oxidase subunit II [Halogeometricum sp. S3BR5-2]MDS0296874.1 cytochrome c oxidase subunit II [Halogeometricum sp. S3BR5-2]
MNRVKQLLLGLGFAVIGMSIVALPVAAAGYDSTTEALIQSLNLKLLYVAVPITILVEGILIYTVWRFRNNDDPKPTKENRRLEITWTVATAIILLFVGVASYQVLALPAVTATPQVTDSEQANATEVTVVGQQFLWTFKYPEENVTSRGTLVLPANRTVYLNITSRDVIHSVHIPELGLKQDAVPGQYNLLRTTPTSQGTYQLYCAEYCGVGHSQMTATVKVVSYDEYQQWLEDQKQSQ